MGATIYSDRSDIISYACVSINESIIFVYISQTEYFLGVWILTPIGRLKDYCLLLAIYLLERAGTLVPINVYKFKVIMID